MAAHEYKLVLHFDGTDGATSTYDATGHHDPDLNGTAQLDTANKKWGSAALLLDGNSDDIDIADSGDWDVFANTTDDWTIHAWIDPDVQATRYIYEQNDGSTSNRHFARTVNTGSTNAPDWRLYSGGSMVLQCYDSSADIGTGSLVHVAFIKVGDEYGIYIDGDQVAYTQDTSTNTISGQMNIGSYQSGSNYFFDGHMDEFVVYKGNLFSASPNSGKTDTITVPVAATVLPLEDTYNDFTVSGADSADITKESAPNTKVSFANLEGDEEAYCYKDYGAGYVTGDYKIRFKVRTESINSSNTVMLFAMSDSTVGTAQDCDTANDGIAFGCDRDNSLGFFLVDHEIGSGSGGLDYTGGNPSYTTYWVELERSSTTLTAKLYSDQYHTLADTLTVTTTTDAYRYVYAIQSYGGGATSGGAGYIDAIEFAELTTTSASASPSVSPSVSPSGSPSVSESASPSVSPSVSPSGSPSVSPSSSPSVSESASPSVSPSVSPSGSPSVSPSSSPSVSPSASPSEGYQAYTKGDYASLPADDADLENSYTGQNYTDVGASNDTRVSQSATGEYAIHQFKDYVGGLSSCTLHWEGQTNSLPSLSTVYLQIYNRDTPAWENVDSDNSSAVNTDFVLTGSIPDLTNYKDINSVISCRVYQQNT
jgi:hypothetical protein